MEPAFSDYSSPIPTEPGLYLFSCAETNDKVENIEIVNSAEGLIVLCPDLGRVPLEMYHNGLSYPKWDKV